MNNSANYRKFITIYSKTQSKINSICLLLFSECNLACEFCDETYYSSTKYDKTKMPLVVDYIEGIKDVIDDERPVQISMMGGEILQDKFDYTIYEEIISRVKEVLKDKKGVYFNIITNALFRNVQRVIDLLDHTGATITVSTDVCGRYTKPYMIPRVLSNIEALTKAGHKPSIAMVATKPAIYSIINDTPEAELFKKLYNDGYFIEFGQYDPRPHATSATRQHKDEGDRYEKYYATTDEIVDFYKVCYKKYPKVAEIISFKNALISREKKRLHCNETWISYWTGPVYCSDNFYCTKMKFLNNLCTTCKFFSFCNGLCFGSNEIEQRCWKKEVLEYIAEQENIVV